MLELIRKHPIAGLLLALCAEAWVALPGEAMIAAAAASAVTRACSLARIVAGGVTGMLCNDLILFGLSRVGRGVVADWLGRRALHLHLSQSVVMGAKFLPPLRSAAYVIYGLQGTPLSHFLYVSFVSSALWVALYTALGWRFQGAIGGWLQAAGRRRGWVRTAEIGLTLAFLAVIWL